MMWIYLYIIPLLINLVAIYIHFKRHIKYREKQNLYELFKCYGFFIWMGILPVANIVQIIATVMVYLMELIQPYIEKILKKIKI